MLGPLFELLLSNRVDESLLVAIELGVAAVAACCVMTFVARCTKRADCCRRCHHDLRSAPHAACPECGASLHTVKARTAKMRTPRWKSAACGVVVAAFALVLASGDNVTRVVSIQTMAAAQLSDLQLARTMFAGSYAAYEPLATRAFSRNIDGSIADFITIEELLRGSFPELFVPQVGTPSRPRSEDDRGFPNLVGTGFGSSPFMLSVAVQAARDLRATRTELVDRSIALKQLNLSELATIYDFQILTSSDDEAMRDVLAAHAPYLSGLVSQEALILRPIAGGALTLQLPERAGLRDIGMRPQSFVQTEVTRVVLRCRDLSERELTFVRSLRQKAKFMPIIDVDWPADSCSEGEFLCDVTLRGVPFTAGASAAEVSVKFVFPFVLHTPPAPTR
jgi:hypothetical protein